MGILKIDRNKKFDPVVFLGPGWKIEEEDKRSLALSEVDLSQVRLEHMLRAGEGWIKGKEKLQRLKKADFLRLDAQVFLTLWENQSLIPENWKEKTDGYTTFIFFDGTILSSPFGRRYVLYLCWDDGRWSWDGSWLDGDWDASSPSAVLAS